MTLISHIPSNVATKARHVYAIGTGLALVYYPFGFGVIHSIGEEGLFLEDRYCVAYLYR